MLLGSISKNGALLAGFALVCVGLIATTWMLTRERIQGSMEAALGRTLNELVPPGEYNNDVQADCALVQNEEFLGSRTPVRVYRMREDGEPVAVILEAVAPNGYSGSIRLVIGIYADETLAGVRVSDHKETPGLGDQIETRKSDWILQFEGLSLDNPDAARWQVRKDGGAFDAFTGATITPRAVVGRVARVLEYFGENKSALFEAPNTCGADTNEP